MNVECGKDVGCIRTFAEHSTEYHLGALAKGVSTSAIFVDIDEDGRLDILL
jgi:hypothetical protein